MPTTTTTKPKSGSSAARREARQSAKPMDILRLLKQEHAEVKKNLAAFEHADTDEEKQQLAQTICRALTLHAELEEAIFYPAAREALHDDDLLNEAKVEHETAKQLIADIEAMSPSDELYDATVKVLGEYIAHHVEEEENELFNECKDSDMDLKALGQAYLEAKEKAQSQKPAKKAMTK
jgi:hemerythrin-like domain-containing protein